MAGTLTQDAGPDGGDAREDWRSPARSSDQVENGVASTSPPPYYDTEEDDCGPKPAELYGKFTWKIESFSQINKRELKSISFDVGGYKWYILIYPQGCDVMNHLSLFLCVANHDKLLPGWSHFAQFTIAVVNKDAKKSKYSDTLHRFWKKEHDWGWKKFIELSKLNEGFLVDDVLIIKAQVQVIRERAERPFRCLDVQYRRELVSVYLSNVDQICRRFIDDRRTKLSRLIDDKSRWASFRAFWLGTDPLTRRHMSRERADTILKILVKHFFLEKEVTSTVVMDAMYSGLRSLAAAHAPGPARSGAGLPMVYVDQDHFVLGDDVVVLLERAVRDTWPQQVGSKEEKGGSQNRSKLEANSGDESSNNPYDRDNKRLTDLGRRTVEFFALIQIFSTRIEVAHQEAVAFRRQEELIREEEAAGIIENEKRERRAKKKQNKQKKNGRKAKDKGNKPKESTPIDDPTDSLIPSKQEPAHIINEAEESDASDNDASEVRESSPVNWETDASETPKQVCTEGKGRKGDESSTSGSDAESSCNGKGRAESERGMKQQSKSKKSNGHAESNTAESSHSTSLNAEPQQDAVVNSVKDWVHSHITNKAEETAKAKKPDTKNSSNSNSNSKMSNFSPSLSPLSIKKQPLNSATNPPKLTPDISPTLTSSTATPKSAPCSATKSDPTPSPSPSPSKLTTPSKNNTTTNPQSRPSIPLTKPTVPVPVPSVPVLARSASSAGRLTTSEGPTFVPTSYRNAIIGTNVTNGSAGTVPTNKQPFPLELCTVPTSKQTSVLELGTVGKVPTSEFPALEAGTVGTNKQNHALELGTNKQNPALELGTNKHSSPLELGTNKHSSPLELGTNKHSSPLELGTVPTNKHTSALELGTVGTNKHSSPLEPGTVGMNGTNKHSSPLELGPVGTNKQTSPLERCTVGTNKHSSPLDLSTVGTNNHISPLELSTVGMNDHISLLELSNIGTIKQTSPLELSTSTSTTFSPSKLPPVEKTEQQKEQDKQQEQQKQKEKEKILQRQLTFTIGTDFERWRASRNPGNEIPQTSTSGSVSDEFPHLDIINDLLNEDSFGAARVTQNHTRNFTRQFSLPDNNRYEGGFVTPYSPSGNTGTSSVNPYSAGGNTGTSSVNPYSTGGNTGTSSVNPYSTGGNTGTSSVNPYSTNGNTGTTSVGTGMNRRFSQVDAMYTNGYRDELAQSHWPPMFNMGEMSNGYAYHQMSDYDYEFGNMISGVNNGFSHPMYRNGY